MHIIGRVGPMPRPKKWVFILGCYGSGTTLLNQLLATHPDIGFLPREGQFLTNQLRTPASLDLSRAWALKPEYFYLTETDVIRTNPNIIKRQWGYYYNDYRRPILVEKSVPNVARIRWLNKNFENAHFIGLIRDPYAVAESIRRKKGYPIEKCIQQWVTSNKILLRDLGAVNQSMLLTYEHFTRQPQQCWEEILRFLGLDSTDQNIADMHWQIHGSDSTIQNMNPLYYSTLSETDFNIIEKHAYSLMHELNYHRPNQR